MANDATFQMQVRRIGEIVEQLESSTDPKSRATGKELLECVMALHGAALERILELATDGGEAGRQIIRNCGRDEVVGSVLLLYGLHPESLRTRVSSALERSRRILEPQGAVAELVSVSDDGAVTVRLEVKSNGCGAASLTSMLEAAIYDAAPDASAIVVEEHGASLTRSGFVPVAQLQSKGLMATPLAGQRSTD